MFQPEQRCEDLEYVTHRSVNPSRQIQNYTQKLAKDTSSMLMVLMKLPVEQPAQRLSRDRLSDECISTLNSFQVWYNLFMKSYDVFFKYFWDT